MRIFYMVLFSIMVVNTIIQSVAISLELQKDKPSGWGLTSQSLSAVCSAFLATVLILDMLSLE